MANIKSISEHSDNLSHYISIQAEGLGNKFHGNMAEFTCKIQDSNGVSDFALVNIYNQSGEKKLNNNEVADAIRLNVRFTHNTSNGNNELQLGITDFFVKPAFQRCGIGCILFQSLLEVVVPYYKGIYLGSPDVPIHKIYISGDLVRDVDYVKGHWESSFPFYFRLHNRLDINALGFSKMNTIFENPENTDDGYNDETDRIPKEDENQYIHSLIEKFAVTNAKKKIKFILS